MILLCKIFSRNDDATYKMVKAMLLDLERRDSRTNYVTLLSGNVPTDMKVKSTTPDNAGRMCPCQIFSKKRHKALSYYNWINFIRLSSMHNRTPFPT